MEQQQTDVMHIHSPEDGEYVIIRAGDQFLSVSPAEFDELFGRMWRTHHYGLHGETL